MVATVRQDKPFGSDYGLIHEAVVTGRRVGAGEQFWARLAHEEDLFRQVVDLVNASPAPTSFVEAKAIMGG